jgi:predicted DNA binding CopG/RHH family protein
MVKGKALKPIPQFATEAEERAFWETHDTAEYVDWSGARLGVFPDLKPSTETISLRLPAGLLAELKTLANQRDVPYQSLLKIFLAERVARERTTRRGTMPNPPLHRAVRAPSRTARR